MKQHPYIRLGQTLGKVPFLRHLNDAEMEEVLLESVILECDSGDTLIEQAAADSDFFILLKGSLRVKRDGEEIALVERAGEIVGERALATGEPRTAAVEAAERSFVLKVSPKFVEQLSKEHQTDYTHDLMEFLMEILATRLDATSQRLAEAEKRIKELEGGEAPS